MAGKWIQSAIKHPGALHAQLGVPQGQKIPAGKLAKAASAGGTLGRRARLAQTLKGFSHLPAGVALTPAGDIGVHRELELKTIERGFTGQLISSSKYFGTSTTGPNLSAAKKVTSQKIAHPQAGGMQSPNEGNKNTYVSVNMSKGKD